MPKINDGVQHPVRRPGAGGILTARRGPAGRGVNFESEAGLKLELEARRSACSVAAHPSLRLPGGPGHLKVLGIQQVMLRSGTHSRPANVVQRH